MPIGETFHALIDSTHHIPVFYPQEALSLEPLGSFVMQSTVLERKHSNEDPKMVEGDPDFTYAIAHIPMESPEAAQETFARAATVFQRGESVGVTVYVYNDTKDIPAMAVRMANEQVGIDVLLRWPDSIRKEDVGVSP